VDKAPEDIPDPVSPLSILLISLAAALISPEITFCAVSDIKNIKTDCP
jgi:hypothetical protein